MEIVVDPEIQALIPPLPDRERQYLEASLRTYGCHDPLKVWGNVLLDGHRRLEICRGYKIPFKAVPIDLPDRDTALLWVEENQLTRHDLTDDQRAAVAVRVLRRRTARAKAAQGTSAASNGAPRPKRQKPKATGSANGDSSLSPLSQAGVAQEARVSEFRVREAVGLEKADADLFGRVVQGEMSLLQAKRELLSRKRLAERTATAAMVKRLAPTVRHGDFRKVLADLPDNSVDLIFVDPPYDKESIPLYGSLAELAARVLVPGGSLVCYAGVHALPRLFPLMTPHIAFWWQLCLRLKAAFPRQHGWRVHVHYKPLLWFVKGKYKGDYVVDVIESTWLEKSWHDWQQSEAEAAHCIAKLTPEDGLVLDPMCGSGTTLVAAKRLGRRYLGVEQDRDQAKVATARLRQDKADAPPGRPLRT
jgi:16S rRNA G966 N2-methylase RsmD